ncbi:MAG: T9SS type A sorting domain-containing protein [Phaeodactylibacter sp.]|uniref:T9SS type A sorting domain-containing protein n=1 Tax=Phaeodactylibacter sp. TaxID=1940289 RepID=UPI0032EFB4FF
MKYSIAIIFVYLLLFKASAQVPDSTFGEINSWEPVTGLEFYGITGFFTEFADDVVQGAIHISEGKIILGGYTVKNDSLDFLMARLLPNGRYDTAIGPMGRKTIDIGYVNDSCTLIANYDESRFLMGGCTYLPGQQDYVGLLTRLDFDGVPDSTFGNGGHLILDLPSKEEMITEAISLPDGKILVGGNAFYGGQLWYESDSTHHFVVRLLPDGRIDSTFANNGILYHTPQDYGGCLAPMIADMALAPDGGIVIAGINYDPYPGELNWEHGYCLENGMFVFKHSPDGEADLSFGEEGAVALPSIEGVPYSMEIRADGKIVICGGVTFGFLNWPTNVFIARLLPNGEVDSSFLGGDYFIKNIIGGTESIKPTSTIQIGEMTYVTWDDEHSGLTFGLMRMDETGQLDSNFVQNEFVGAQGNGVLFSSYEWLPFIRGIVKAYSIDSTGVYFVGRVGGSGAPYNRNMFIAKVKLPPPVPVSTVAVPWRPLSFSAYPNPVRNGVLHLSPATGPVSGPLSIRLADLQGRLVWQQQVTDLQGASTIDVSGLKSGMYILDVSGQAGRWVEKIVISE